MADVKFTLSTIDDFTSKLNKLENAFKKVNGEANKLGSVKFNNLTGNEGNIFKSPPHLKSQIQLEKQRIQFEIDKFKIQAKENNLIKTEELKLQKENTKAKNSLINENSKTQNYLLKQKTKFEIDRSKIQDKESNVNKIEELKTQNYLLKQKTKFEIDKLKTQEKEDNIRRREELKSQNILDRQKAKFEIEKFKAQEKANKAEIRANLEKTKLNQKIADSFRTAKVTPINYTTDSTGKVIGISKAGGTTTAEIAPSANLGGKYIKKAPEPRSGGLFGSGRTFGNVLKAYGSYKVISGVEQGLGNVIAAPLGFEQARASIGAMLFASGVPRDQLPAAVEDDMKFIFEMAQKYKSDPLNIANNYKMALSSMATKTPGKRNLDKNEIRGITEGFLNISRVSGLTTDDTSSVFLALSQMLGKGKIQAQEVNLQMSQRIPAIKNLLRKSVDETIKDPRLSKMYEPYKNLSLDEMMEKGIISSDILVNFQKVINETFQDMYVEKGKTLTAESQALSASFKELSDTTSNLI